MPPFSSYNFNISANDTIFASACVCRPPHKNCQYPSSSCETYKIGLCPFKIWQQVKQAVFGVSENGKSIFISVPHFFIVLICLSESSSNLSAFIKSHYSPTTASPALKTFLLASTNLSGTLRSISAISASGEMPSRPVPAAAPRIAEL